MSTSPPDEHETLRRLLEEGSRLAALMPACHEMANELQAVVLVSKMHGQGFNVAVSDAESCVERMRVAVASGTYPQHLLEEAKLADKEVHAAVGAM
ncbi:MAG: hypothetical protein U0984_10055 [Prosthecobacter sp.]|nr:hypothetical protein [Prosthecobacter sp.]